MSFLVKLNGFFLIQRNTHTVLQFVAFCSYFFNQFTFINNLLNVLMVYKTLSIIYGGLFLLLSKFRHRYSPIIPMAVI